MAGGFDNGKEPMLDIFIFETNQLLEQLEAILLRSESDASISAEGINEIFRIMHTIKGSAAMMGFSNISAVSHAAEDLFEFIRHTAGIDDAEVIDVALSALDFIRLEMDKIRVGKKADGNEKSILQSVKKTLKALKSENDAPAVQRETPKGPDENHSIYYIGFPAASGSEAFQKYYAKIFFENGCGMENIRAFSLVFALKDLCTELYYRPCNIAEDESAAEDIIKNGLHVYFSSDLDYESIVNQFGQVPFVKSCALDPVEGYDEEIADIVQYVYGGGEKSSVPAETVGAAVQNASGANGNNHQKSFINVDTDKLDRLLDLVGEIAIAESMVTKNPEIQGLNLESFDKTSRHLQRLLDELQDSVMSIRMVPMAEIFHKMRRIVRDMTRKLEKDVDLVIIGEETEVDKNVIHYLADPLMHLVRNSMDHGIESREERIRKGKPEKGKITITASNSGAQVTVMVADDGKGLDRDEILKAATERGLLEGAAVELSDNEVFAFILHPGFSTRKEVTEFSGRGVGMDVVKENVTKTGGEVVVDSMYGQGTVVTIRMPLTLAVIAGMKVAVGKNIYTIPTVSVNEFLKADKHDLLTDTQGNEIIMIRGECYPVLRLHKLFHTLPAATDLCEGVMVMVEWGGKKVCLFADHLVGEQSVVAKPVPDYLTGFFGGQNSIGGCTILGDGSVSLILDVKNIINQVI